MDMAAGPKDLLKISQLARRAGVSIPTVKHYVREGLLPRPKKTSRNMAYYREDDIHRIRLVKKLQKERFLPLEVIKRLLDAGESFDEELALGRAILKTDRAATYAASVKRADVAAVTGYPLDRIDILEEKGLIHPLTEDGGKAYLSEDLALIEMMQQRDDLGVPFDASLATLRIYADALVPAVQEDINFFIRNIMADTPTRQAIQFITKADETLDRFIISFRQKMLRQFSEKTIKGLNQLPNHLAVLNFLPIDSAALPEQPPQNPVYRRVYQLLAGGTPAAAGMDAAVGFAHEPPRLRALGIVSILMSGRTQTALALVQEFIPGPTHRALENTVAALTYLFAMEMSSGFSVPMFNIKKVLHHLSRIEQMEREPSLDSLFARYVCGAVYIFLPGVFATRHKGIELLETLNRELAGLSCQAFDLPGWLTRVLDTDILPALQVRANRFLARGYVKTGDKSRAVDCLAAIVSRADPDSDHAAWARLEQVRLSK